MIKADGTGRRQGRDSRRDRRRSVRAVDDCFTDAAGGVEVVVEECMVGPEASLFCLCDGENAIAFGTAEDHKRAYDGDRGRTPAEWAPTRPPAYDPGMTERAMREIVRPTLEGMRELGAPFRGVLYAGLMLTAEGPKLIEYNVRFGDPEAQVLMMRLESDLLPILLTAATGSLAGVEPRWSPEPAVTVVLAAKGYPGAVEKGTAIGSVPEEGEGEIVFHAGTAVKDGRLIASGVASSTPRRAMPTSAGRSSAPTRSSTPSTGRKASAVATSPTARAGEPTDIDVNGMALTVRHHM